MSTTVDEAGPRPPTTTPDPAPARSRPQHFDIPPLIRRNTVLLALTQAFVGMGNQTTPTLAPIIASRMLGSPDLAGARHQHPRPEPPDHRVPRRLPDRPIRSQGRADARAGTHAARNTGHRRRDAGLVVPRRRGRAGDLRAGRRRRPAVAAGSGRHVRARQTRRRARLRTDRLAGRGDCGADPDLGGQVAGREHQRRRRWPSSGS